MESWWKWLFAGATGIVIVIIRLRTRGKIYRGKALLVGKTVIITGANCGIGKATACELAKRKARVILACRDVDKANAAVSDIRSVTQEGDLIVKKLDMSSFGSIRQFAKDINQEEEHLDILINNAGVFQCPLMKTEDGMEMQMGVNHLGHFLLTNLLLDKLKKSSAARVVVVSSGLHKLAQIDFDNLNSEQSYDKRKAYRNSKLANNLFARELASRCEGSSVSVYCLHPGMAFTQLGRHVPMPLLMKILLYPLGALLVKTAWEACQTVVYCAVDEKLEGVSRKYFGNCRVQPWSVVSLDDGTAEKLWEVSEQLTKLSKKD